MLWASRSVDGMGGLLGERGDEGSIETARRDRRAVGPGPVVVGAPVYRTSRMADPRRAAGQGTAQPAAPSTRRVGAERPDVAGRVLGGVLARAVVLVQRAVDDLGRGLHGARVVGVGVVDDDVGGRPPVGELGPA